jgi:phytoene dehydrogenase-like protein
VRYDAIVVGGGHNGLTCAAYLGRAGLSVLVLEARDTLGGMAHLALTVGRLSPVVARELGLKRHGLRLVQPDVRTFAPQPDDRGALTLWGDVARTARELAANSLAGQPDAEAYVQAHARLNELAHALAPILRKAPADLASPTLGASARSVAGAARVDGQLLRFMPMAVRDLVEDWFESDALRAAIAARGVLYTAMGPRAPGTTGVLLTEAATSTGGLAGQAVFARGGARAVTTALAAAVTEKGGVIRTAARVVRVRHGGDHAIGVTLERGEEIDAPVVVSGLDPQTTLLDLLEPEVLGPRLSWRAGNIRQRGATAALSYTLRALPVFPAAFDDAQRLRGRILIAPSMHYLELAARPARHGADAEEPLLEITIPSLVDPGLADDANPKVHHVMSVVAQAVTTSDSSRVGDTVTRTIERYAPGFTDLVVERTTLTPADIERQYGVRGGHPMHAEIALDQWYEWRPLHGYGRYRMPLDGLYLCASGAHPGGGVTGLPGRLAAREVFADARQRRLGVSP